MALEKTAENEKEDSNKKIRDRINSIIMPFDKDIPQERIQLGGAKKLTTEPDKIETYVNGGFKTILSTHYAEGTSIPVGSANIYAVFDKEGNRTSEYSDLEKIDFSKGAVIHKELSHGGENYNHWLFHVNDKGKISQIATFSDYYDKIIPVVGETMSPRQIWYSFHGSDTVNRRHNDFKHLDDWIIIPFKKTHWGGYPNPKVPMEHGLIYHNTKTSDSLIIEKIPEIMFPKFITGKGKLNLKADILKLNGEQIDKTNGWIDLVKTEGNKAYIDNYEIIDLNHLEIGGVGIYRNSNPTDPLDELIKREYDTHQFRKAGPQIRHTIKLLDIEKGSYNTLTGFTDNGASGYEHYSMPADKGIIVVSRETGEKEHIIS